MPSNVFVLGLDDASHAMLRRLPRAGDVSFHALLHRDELRGVAEFPFDDLLETAEQRLEAFPGSIDAIVSLLDFPATELVPLLARRHGLRAPTLDAVLRCTHKYWSRLLQREVAPEHVPAFLVFDPAPDVAASIDLDGPYWVKPLNAYRSHLGFRIGRAAELDAALPVLREELPRLARPLEEVMAHANMPERLLGLGPGVCLAEGLIGGRQCTVEGYVHEGAATSFAVVDSIRDRNRVTFARYQYPSTLPRTVQRCMADIAERVMEHIGYDQGCFNMEFFWDRRRDRVWILEVNPRLSVSHCELFELVDGASHAQVLVDVALGRRPRPPRREGEASVAATCFVRAFQDGVVTRAPTPEEAAAATAGIPSARVDVLVSVGQRLSELRDQDSYSYELATVRIGADSQRELLRRLDAVLSRLPLTIEPVKRL